MLKTHQSSLVPLIMKDVLTCYILITHLIMLTFYYVMRNLDNHPQPYCDKLDTIEEFLERDSVDCDEVVESLGELNIESQYTS